MRKATGSSTKGKRKGNTKSPFGERGENRRKKNLFGKKIAREQTIAGTSLARGVACRVVAKKVEEKKKNGVKERNKSKRAEEAQAQGKERWKRRGLPVSGGFLGLRGPLSLGLTSFMPVPSTDLHTLLRVVVLLVISAESG